MPKPKQKEPRSVPYTARELIVELAKWDPSTRVYFMRQEDDRACPVLSVREPIAHNEVILSDEPL